MRFRQPGSGRRTGNATVRRPRVNFLLQLIAVISVLGRLVAAAQDTRLAGEYTDIKLGRPLINRSDFPSIGELRRLAQQNELQTILMFKLHHEQGALHLPAYSPNGQQLAFQRTTRGTADSKLFLFSSLSQVVPDLITRDERMYDYMFQWCVNSPTSFVFSRIATNPAATRVYFASEGSEPEIRTPNQREAYVPSLYERLDGGRYLAYESGGQIIQQTWRDQDVTEKMVMRGTSPRWSRDGSSIMVAKETSRTGDVTLYQPVWHDLTHGRTVAFPVQRAAVVRTPVFSPDERLAAWYERDPGDRAPWRLQVCPIAEGAQPTTVADNVKVNPDFRTSSPSWEPQGKRLWCLSATARREEYYPLLGVAPDGRHSVQVDYPEMARSARDLTLNPAAAIPEFAFVANTGAEQDLFVILLNHY